jgi:ATPase family associated with various cellular activities (AAA)
MTLATQSSLSDWNTANQHYLMEAIASIRHTLEHCQDESDSAPAPRSPFPPTLNPAALDMLCQIFELSSFDRDVLLLCAGMEFDQGWAELCAAAQGDPRQSYPTLGLALSVLPDASWVSLTPNAPLRRWQLLDIGAGNALTNSPIRISERILNYLAGVQHCDEQLTGLIQPMTAKTILVSSHQQVVDTIIKTWLQMIEAGCRLVDLPVIQLCGEDSLSKRAIAFKACQEVGLGLHAMSVEGIPSESHLAHRVKLLCEREYLLSDTTLLLDNDYHEQSDAAQESIIAQLIEHINLPLIVTGRDRRRQRQRPIITFEIYHPTTAEQRLLWQESLTDSELPAEFATQIPTLVSHFNLGSTAIQTACLHTQNAPEPTPQLLWDACRVQARPRLDELSQRIESSADWEDLILPDPERQVLKEVAAHVKQRSHVYENWGFGAKSKRGLGISALFAGGSGTGKTMAAEVLAKELKLDVYRIDLSSVVSKYIGETEKNLRRVFDAAEGGGVILLFDEADALFGKRGEVKDSHDRYANMEVGYLLQRMEAYRGLAILTSNLKGSIDQAFLRRIRFIVQFPFPDATQRAEIWRKSFPSQTPVAELDFTKLAKLNVAGGNIRCIVLNAAFLAAEAGESVGMSHILQAAKSEYLKLERPLTDSEIKGWV